jgi:hypothetical protein
MKYKEKEKLWLKSVKDLSKSDGWKFKSYFIYKIVNDFFFSSTFYISLKENAISGYLGYKPLNIDNIFWDIINEHPNKKRPLSFRAEAAFCIREINYFEYKIDIPNELNPEFEISELLKAIDIQVFEKNKNIQTLTDFNRLSIRNVRR